MAAYKGKLSTINCQHFAQGDGVCPFGTRWAVEQAYACSIREADNSHQPLAAGLPASAPPPPLFAFPHNFCAACSPPCPHSCFYRHAFPDGTLDTREPGLRKALNDEGGHAIAPVRLAAFFETPSARRTLRR